MTVWTRISTRLARSDAYRVERTLGSRDGLTELVYFAGEGGTRLGPFVRKRIELATGLGGAYEELLPRPARGQALLPSATRGGML